MRPKRRPSNYDVMQAAWVKYVRQQGGRPPLTCILASGNKADELQYIRGRK